jgi:uncharacterized protein (DUF697 family)
MTTETITVQETHHNEQLASRTEKGKEVIHRNVLWALGAGVVPLPLVDMVAVLAVELKMLKQLSDAYDAKFTDDVAKKVVASLLTSVGSVGLGIAVAGSLFKIVPVIGSTLGVVSVPVFAATFTSALGKIFQMHLETGGTLLDFDPKAVRTHFKREFDRSKVEVAQMHKDLESSKVESKIIIKS